MGAAGSVEAIASVMSIRDGVVPPTINFREIEPACGLNVVANSKLETHISAVLCNSAGIGGCNAAVVIREVET